MSTLLSRALIKVKDCEIVYPCFPWYSTSIFLLPSVFLVVTFWVDLILVYLTPRAANMRSSVAILIAQPKPPSIPLKRTQLQPNRIAEIIIHGLFLVAKIWILLDLFFLPFSLQQCLGGSTSFDQLLFSPTLVVSPSSSSSTSCTNQQLGDLRQFRRQVDLRFFVPSNFVFGHAFFLL